MSDTAIPRAFHTLADADLIEALRSGDAAAFEALFEKYHTALVRLARMYVNDLAAAEEVAQDARAARQPLASVLGPGRCRRRG
jgi:hypothetical protein